MSLEMRAGRWTVTLQRLVARGRHVVRGVAFLEHGGVMMQLVAEVPATAMAPTNAFWLIRERAELARRALERLKSILREEELRGEGRVAGWAYREIPIGRTPWRRLEYRARGVAISIVGKDLRDLLDGVEGAILELRKLERALAGGLGPGFFVRGR